MRTPRLTREQVERVDVLAWCEHDLALARRDLSRRVDRAEALAELYEVAVALTAERRETVDFDDLFTGVGEQRRAELNALLHRAIAEPDEHETTTEGVNEWHR